MDLDTQQSRARAQFSRQSQNYGKAHILSQTDDLRSVAGVLAPKRGERLLDIATGNGHCAMYYARLGLEVTASDISSAMLSNAAALADEAGLRIDFREHQAEALPYDADSFAIVTCRVAAHHFSCPATFMMEVRRVLKPGGRFLLIDGTVEDGYPVAEAWLHDVESLRDPSHNRFIRPDAWTHLCGHVGLKVIQREIQPLRQPDLRWYFQTADTPPENRTKVIALMESAPEEARSLFRLAREQDTWTWWWQQLVLVAVRH